uniref:Uncharacterized protein n=1 Tax=Anguilla anguilla TaxID=7936 RepID=A0A0E9WSV0_ANGAN
MHVLLGLCLIHHPNINFYSLTTNKVVLNISEKVF